MSRNSRKKKKDFFEKYDYSSLSFDTPVCPHFNTCGGCRFQNIKYEDQIKLKKDYLKALFDKSVDVILSSNPFYYRNRMDFVYAYDKLGLRKKGDFREVIDIKECHLIPSFANDVFQHIKQLLIDFKIPSYDFIEHVGFLRFVVLRFVPSTKETMAIFTSNKPILNQEKLFNSFLDELSSLDLKINSIYWFINETITDINIPLSNPVKVIGKESLIETIGDTSLSFGPKSFFQANTVMSELIFNQIKEFTSGETIDLCCGVGSIGLFVSDKTNSLLGIEEVSEAIDFAKENVVLNNISNAHFINVPMKKILEVAPMHVDTLILDPPRAGLGNKVIQKILEINPSRIIYMSCNPKTQKSDLDILIKSNSYKITFLQGYDMFAQTTHLETLCVLDRVDSEYTGTK